MNVAKLSIKNFLSVSEVSIAPGQVNQICGENNMGKTTILKALEFAMTGSTDGSLVKFGEDSAEVIVELSDSTEIRRRLSVEGRQSVEVKREGCRTTSPQSFLESLFSKSSFNPLELLDPKKRTEAIMASIVIKLTPDVLAGELGLEQAKLPPLDYDQHGLKVLDQAHKYFYQRRFEANKDTLDKKNRFETYQADLPQRVPTLPDMMRVRTALEKERDSLAVARERMSGVDKVLESATLLADKVVKCATAVQQIDIQIASAEEHLRLLRVRREAAVEAHGVATLSVPTDLPDKSEIEIEISMREKTVATHNQTLAEIDRAATIDKQYQLVEDLKVEFEKAAAFAESLNLRVIALAGPIKDEIMAMAEMPIEGLEYVNGAFLVEGVPVDNLSSSRALKLAMGVARKLAKKTKLICVDGCEILDEESFEILQKEIEGDGYQYFLTKVGEPFAQENSVFKMDRGNLEVAK